MKRDVKTLSESQKRARRRHLNRLAAQQSRAKKQRVVQETESKLHRLERENKELLERIRKLETENAALKSGHEAPQFYTAEVSSSKPAVLFSPQLEMELTLVSCR